MGLYRLPAIVLRTHPFSDTHLIATLMSPTHGKVRALAKGSRRIQSALGRAVQPLIYGLFQLAEGKNLDCMTQGVVKRAFPRIRGNLERLCHGLYALELIDRLMEEPEQEANIFFLLLKTLEGLESGAPPVPLLRAFEAHLFDYLGYAPLLDCCVYCSGKTLLARFSARLGGVLCLRCQERDKLSIPVPAALLAGMKACFDSPPGEAPDLAETVAPPLATIFQRYLEDKCGKAMHGFVLVQQVGGL